MAKFIGNLVVSFILVGGAILILRSLPDIARYLEIREK